MKEDEENDRKFLAQKTEIIKGFEVLQKPAKKKDKL